MPERRWLYYMAPRANAEFIVHLGIYSYNRLSDHPELKARHQSIADPSVNSLRHCTMAGGRPLHDYVPLYWATHTPMQYIVTQSERRLAENDLVFFLFDPDQIFSISGVLSTDGNAAHSETTFYEGRGAEPCLDWRILEERSCYSREYKRRKAAEVLVPDHISANLVTSVAVQSKVARRALRSEIARSARSLPLPQPRKVVIRVCPEFYYSNPDFVLRVERLLRQRQNETDL